MSSTSGLFVFVVLLLPLIGRGIPNPVGLRWLILHGDRPMPTDVEKRAQQIGLYIPLLQVTLMAGASWLLLGRIIQRTRLIGLIADGWRSMILYGAIAGGCWLVINGGLLFILRRDTVRLGRNAFVQQPVAFSVALSLCAALAEEMWRCACLIALAAMGSGISVVLTAVIFGLGHRGGPGRLVSMTFLGLYLGSIFVTTLSLLAIVTSHAVVNIGTLWMVRITYRRALASHFTHK